MRLRRDLGPDPSGWLLLKTGNDEAPMTAILFVLLTGVLCYVFVA